MQLPPSPFFSEQLTSFEVRARVRVGVRVGVRVRVRVRVRALTLNPNAHPNPEPNPNQVQAAGSSAEVPSVLSSLFTAVAVRAGQLRAAVAVVGEIKHRREVKRAELHYRLEKAGSGRVLRYMLLHGHHAALQRQQAALKTQRVHHVVKSFLETVAPRSERPERSEWFSRITSEGDRRKSRSRKVSEGARTGDPLRGVVRTRHSSPDPYIAPP